MGSLMTKQQPKVCEGRVIDLTHLADEEPPQQPPNEPLQVNIQDCTVLYYTLECMDGQVNTQDCTVLYCTFECMDEQVNIQDCTVLYARVHGRGTNLQKKTREIFLDLYLRDLR